jgi:hypothetical protein
MYVCMYARALWIRFDLCLHTIYIRAYIHAVHLEQGTIPLSSVNNNESKVCMYVCMYTVDSIRSVFTYIQLIYMHTCMELSSVNNNESKVCMYVCMYICMYVHCGFDSICVYIHATYIHAYMHGALCYKSY